MRGRRVTGPRARLVDVRATLEGLSTDADVLAIRAPDAERPAAQVLAETARTAHRALAAPVSSLGGAMHGGGALPWSVCLRLARMEQWLTARATTDPSAVAAADLCLWVLDQVEGDPR